MGCVQRRRQLSLVISSSGDRSLELPVDYCVLLLFAARGIAPLVSRSTSGPACTISMFDVSSINMHTVTHTYRPTQTRRDLVAELKLGSLERPFNPLAAARRLVSPCMNSPRFYGDGMDDRRAFVHCCRAAGEGHWLSLAASRTRCHSRSASLQTVDLRVGQ